MKLLSTIVLLSIASLSFAQRQNVYFLKYDGKYVDVLDSADYFRVVREPDSGSMLYNVFEFYKDQKRKLIGKSSTIDPPRFEGTCTKFYKTGVRQSIANYTNGRIVDQEYLFFPNGKPYLVKEYSDDDSPGVYFGDNYIIQESYDTLGTIMINGGNGYYKGYDEDFKNVIEQGKFKNGKRDSVWKGNFKKDTVIFTETYEDGKLIAGAAVFGNGTTSTYSNFREVVPQFKGGIEAFYNYLSRSIHYPSDARDRNIQGRVIKFIVQKDGRIDDVTVIQSVNQSLDEEALRVIKASPRWIPGMEFGRNVRVSYSVPIGFTLSQ